MKKILPIGVLFLCLVSYGFAQTAITSNTTITQNWVNNHAGPWTISNGVTVTFGGNLTLSSTTQYFIITTSNGIIDGSGHIVTLNGIINFTGLVNASNSNVSGAIIKNIGVQVDNLTTLLAEKGYISGKDNYATIFNCYSTGTVSGLNSGGIAGYYNQGNISNCYSTGNISGDYSGGITGRFNSGNISNCYSTGAISGSYSGGISTSNFSTISNCYSTGAISGSYSGGIAGYYNSGNISNCYSSGKISGTSSGGISVKNENSSIINCRSSGEITLGAVGIATNFGTGSQSNAFNVTPTIANTWDNTIADDVLTGFGSIWNTFTSPITLVSSFIFPPTFANLGPITLCLNGSYFLDPSTTDGIFSSSVPSVAIVNSSGYVTAVSASGSTDISLITTSGVVSATVTVGSTSSVTITDLTVQPNYKFDNGPHGPTDGTINYVGYNGFTYSSQTRPTNTGYYRASKQVGNEAGCPVPFYIIKCDSCN